MKSLQILFISVLLITIVHAIPQPSDQYINDFAQILNESDQQTLRGAFSIVEANTTAQIVFVSVEDTEGYDISEYATMLGQNWGVGQSDKDNGLVILYVKDTNKIWVAAGYGVEGVLPDSKIGRILDQTYVPLRDAGDVATGIVYASLTFSQELMKNAEELRSKNSHPKNNQILWIIVAIILILIILSIVSRKKGLRTGPFIFIPTNWGGSSSGSSWGGGASFGGGSFGGGGAGR